ncbi:calcium-binding protein [Acaryochloris sp. IP29b_bin.137]|uniref:calcium-binding protein n=1 Tax=Acaryochloris sp. IP29b_bin.137 TaxID=2969217 RepID=UPI002616BD32|nr:calcium-binding protein [Acaryochloris sp. IP29b_bin.137]
MFNDHNKVGQTVIVKDGKWPYHEHKTRTYSLGTYDMTAHSTNSFNGEFTYVGDYKHDSKSIWFDFGYYTTVQGSEGDDTITGTQSRLVDVYGLNLVLDMSGELNGKLVESNDGILLLPSFPFDAPRYHTPIDSYEIVMQGQTLYGNGGDDFIVGSAAMDTEQQEYLGGNDTLYGGANNDILIGGDGFDLLYGDEEVPSDDDGNDTIYIESPNGKGDHAWGGGGQDTFVFGQNFSTTITTETTNTQGYGWQSLATGAAADIMGIAIDAAGPGVSAAWKIGKGVVSLAGRAIGGFFGMGGEETQVETYVPGNIQSPNAARIHDFNPQEDVLIIPINGGDSNVYTVVDGGQIYVKYHNDGATAAIIDIDISGDYFGEYGIHDANDLTTKLVAESVQRSAMRLISTEAGDLQAKLGAAYKATNAAASTDPTDPNVSITTVTNTDLGADFLILGAYGGNAIAPGGAGAEKLYGTMHADRLFSYAVDDQHDDGGKDKLFGFGGDDILAGGGGADDYYGGYGFDFVSYEAESGLGDDNETQARGVIVDLSNDDLLEADLLAMDPKDRPVDPAPSATSDNIRTIDGKEGALYSTATDAWGAIDRLFSIEGIIGSQFGDTITGNNEVNVFNGGDGNDTLDGGGGNDTLIGGDGNDTLDGGGGNDTLIGGAGSDTLIGDAVAGNDTLIVDAGADTFVLDTTEGGIDTIRGFSLAENDVLLIDNKSLGTSHAKARNLNGMLSATGLKLQLGNVGIATIENVDSSNVHRVLGRVEFTTSSHINTPLGLGDDLLSTGDGNDRLTGGSGDDLLSGGAGNDTLLGGTHKDLLLGGRGDDLLNGGKGIDRLYGGSGADTFVINNTVSGLNKRSGIDVIQDFSVDEFDHIQIDASVFGIGINDHHLVQLGNDSFLRVNNRKIAQLTGVDVNTFVTDEHVDLV